MFFARPGTYKPCGIYTVGHFALLVAVSIGVIIALKYTKNKNNEEVKRIIRRITVFLWILEIVKIIFNIIIGNVSNPNTYIPLYFCSIILYAGILSGFCKGRLKRTGDVFLSTGGLIAGIVFLLYPSTSLPTYPIFHYISIQSMILHGAMVYLGILLNITHYIELEKKDINYYAILILIISVLAYMINNMFDSNLMFISKDFPGTPITLIYHASRELFTTVMVVGQATVPFYVVYGIRKLIYKKEEK